MTYSKYFLVTLVLAAFTAASTATFAQTPLPLRVIVKFKESNAIRLRASGFIGSAAIGSPPPPSVPPQEALDAIYLQLTGGAGAVLSTSNELSRLFSAAEDSIDAQTLALRIAGKSIADINNYFVTVLPSPLTSADARTLIDWLLLQSTIQTAYLEPPPAPPPQVVDVPPTTPDFVPLQGYLLPAASGGVDAAAALPLPGGKGRWTRVIDVEYSTLPHEDFPPVTPSLSIAGNSSAVANGFHGHAVNGIIHAQHNGYGINGLAPDALFGLVSEQPLAGFNPANAVYEASLRLRPGDVLLLEMQWQIPIADWPPYASSCPEADRLIPYEYFQADFDAVQFATAAGRVVVQTASNGGCDLDAPFFAGRFNRSVRDSGAIFVGAGRADQTRLGFSPFGSRLDVQSWGANIFTSGSNCNVLFPGGVVTHDVNCYTNSFGGTSGAGAIVAGVAAVTQSLKTNYFRGRPLNSQEMRSLLSTSVTAQPAADIAANGRIGGQPDLSKIVTTLASGLACSPDYTPAAGCNLDVDGDGTLGEWDALFIIRYILGFRGASLAFGQPTPPVTCATRVTASQLESHLNTLFRGASAALDVDGDTKINALTDGLLLLRLFRERDSLVKFNGVLGATASRSNYAAIRAHLNTTCNTTFPN